MKLSYEDRKEIIRLYFDKSMGYGSIAKKYGSSPTTIRRIIDLYKTYGEESLKRKQYTTYSPEFKYEVISKFLNGESKTMLSTEYNISTSRINSWLEKYNELGYDGLKDKRKGRPPKMKKKEEVIEEAKNIEETEDIEIKDIDLNSLDPKVKEYILSQQKEIEYIRTENAILKKYQALVQQKK